jgi:hypothetical protein
MLFLVMMFPNGIQDLILVSKTSQTSDLLPQEGRKALELEYHGLSQQDMNSDFK